MSWISSVSGVRWYSSRNSAAGMWRSFVPKWPTVASARCQYLDRFRPERGQMLKQGLVQADGTPYPEFPLRPAYMNAL